MGAQSPWHEQTVAAFGDLAGGPYDQRAERLVVVARK
jgi:hypothetical protein